MTSKEYREYLVECIKATGQELIDRADTLIGKDLELIGDVHIDIDFRQNEFPRLSIATEVVNKNMFNIIKNKENK